MNENFDLIEKNISAIQEAMSAYPNAHLMAAIKTRSDEEVRKAYECGVRYFGENRVQELLAHYECVRSLPEARLHMIGTLQTNKVKYIIDKVDMIESLSSISLAKEIDKRAEKCGIKMPVLIEVNIGREAQKDGIFPEDLPAFLKELAAFPSVLPKGLMTIAPVCEKSEDYAPYFTEMVRLRDEVFAPLFPNEEKPLLSMGMSGNYREALRHGTDFVRIGTGIFGARHYPTDTEVKK
ncbi:MAG: YggS family pyridoxal phosphate-dependent enzyme [Clostridia bacterium]|nr:YggS family pyridoxal phosphate-dependent enzyme [Clostridia bacterium]MBQ8862516.1 YggS family pyridoxal phosphate-dependent enzyme [Clostridia bacterium]